MIHSKLLGAGGVSGPIVEFIDSATTHSSTLLTVPALAETGDLMVVAVASNASLSTPAGWTVAFTANSQTNVLYKINAGETTLQFANNANSAVVMAVFRNASWNTADDGRVAAAWPSVAGFTSYDMVVAAGARFTDDNVFGVTPTDYTLAARQTDDGSFSADSDVVIFYKAGGSGSEQPEDTYTVATASSLILATIRLEAT